MKYGRELVTINMKEKFTVWNLPETVPFILKIPISLAILGENE